MWGNVKIKFSKIPQYGVYHVSPDGSTNHKELFTHATRDFFGYPLIPMFLPKFMAYPGLIMKNILGRLRLVSQPFEKFWMIKYIDLKLNVDTSLTRKILSWEPTPRYHILRRLIYLLDKMKSHPNEWHLLNEAATKRDTSRPNLLIYEQLIANEDELLKAISATIMSKDNKERFPNYQQFTPKRIKIALSTLFNLLLASVRSSDRTLMQKYIGEIAMKRFTVGFEAKEMTDAIATFGEVITETLLAKKELGILKQEIYDYIGLTLQLAMDEVEDVFENMDKRISKEKLALLTKQRDAEREKEIKSLSAFYQEYPE